MVTFVYDGTFEGLLTAIFDAYLRRSFPDELVRIGEVLPMFSDEVHDVVTDDAKSSRVWNAVTKKLSKGAVSAVTTSFLCEVKEYDITLFRFLCKTINAPASIETDFSDQDVIEVLKMYRRVKGEAHRVLQFMRLQKAADGTYFGLMEPIYNVMPMAVSHFVDRFSTMSFLLYDKRRGFGFYYDGNNVTRVTMPDTLQHIVTGKLSEDMMDSDEMLFQKLWRTYFKAIAIKERSNPRKQRQDMPVRFWKYMTEKNG